PAMALTANQTNPQSAPTNTGNWGSQILAFRLNVEFSCAGIFDSVGLVIGDFCYGGYMITSECGMGKFDGMSVYTFLAIADSAVGGLDVLGNYGADFSDVNKTATCLNELFVGCGDEEDVSIWQSAGTGAKPSSEEAGTRPEEFSLSQNYPNPFNPDCNIDYAIPIDCHVTLSVYNILGQTIRVLVDEHQGAGYRSVTWDGKDSQGLELTTGVYFYRIQAGNFVESKKMILIK
ncbi:MAG: T9SS type A sorting domain-containing protein, partial [Candidatus Zixiibacteriota bacterium]